MFRSHKRFALLLLMFIAGSFTHYLALPALEGNDEPIHFNYVTWLRTQKTLPDRASFMTNSTLQASGQPPLTYLTAVFFVELFNAPYYAGDVLKDLRNVSNLWFAPPDPWHRKDNPNLYFHRESELRYQDIVQINRMARLSSILFGVLAVIGAYGASREVFQDERWALTATAIFAFSPAMIYMSAILSNDVSGTAFAALTIWQTLRLIRCGATPGRLILIGILLGFGGLSKINSLLVLPGVAAAVIIPLWQKRASIYQIAGRLLLIGLAMTLVMGPWIAYGVVTFNDPLGLKTHDNHPEFAHLPPPTITELLTTLPDVFYSYWGKFGTSSIWMSPPVYAVFGFFTLLSIIGYAGYISSHRITIKSIPPILVQQSIVLGIAFLFAFAGLLYWLRSLFYLSFVITGRLMYSGHVAVAIGLTGGLYLLIKSTGIKILRPLAVSFFAGCGFILAPMIIAGVFAPPPMLTNEQLPPLQGTAIDYENTIRFLGYQQPKTTLKTGAMHNITLCWQVLKFPERPGAFAIKVFDGSQIVAERTSVHGLGHFNTDLWKPGYIFCDNVDIPVSSIVSIQSGKTYDMMLIMLDSQTGEVNWNVTTPEGHFIEYPFIGKLTGE